GLAAAAGAAIAYYLNLQKKPATDPWATPPVGGAPGVDTQVRSSLADRGTATTRDSSTGSTMGAGTGTTSTTTDSRTSTTRGATTGHTAAAAVGAGGAAGDASDTPIADSLSSRSSSTGTTSETDGGAGAARMLAGDEIDQLGSDTPVVDDDIPGSSSTSTSGFGTDFGDDSGTSTGKHAATDSEVEGSRPAHAEDSSDRETDLPSADHNRREQWAAATPVAAAHCRRAQRLTRDTGGPQRPCDSWSSPTREGVARPEKVSPNPMN